MEVSKMTMQCTQCGKVFDFEKQDSIDAAVAHDCSSPYFILKKEAEVVYRRATTPLQSVSDRGILYLVCSKLDTTSHRVLCWTNQLSYAEEILRALEESRD